MTNSNPVWTEIEAGDAADANIIMDNFRVLQNSISDTTQSVSNKESISMKNAAGGYCGLDNNGKIPSERIGSDIIATILGSIYPVGSIYITVSNSDTCPIASLIPDSTWVKVDEGRVLQQAGTWDRTTHNPGTKVSEGLPNLEGKISVRGWGNSPSCDGVFTKNYQQDGDGDHDGDYSVGFRFRASDDNVIYGNSSHVQPPAYCVNFWRRTA